MVTVSLSNSASYSAPLSRVQEPTPPPVRYRFVWDDENPDWGYKCRTQSPGWHLPQVTSPPAVLRYYPTPKESGDYRVNLSTPYDWKPTVIEINEGDERKWSYWCGPSRAQFNSTGWPMFAYVGMCGNEIKILERAGEWVKFETLKQSDAQRARSMRRATHPQMVHTFTCISFRNGQTVHVTSTGTPRGIVDYPLVTRDGFAWIPARHVVKV